MKPPPPLRLAPRCSRLVAAIIIASYAATAALLQFLPLPAVVRLGGAAGIAAAGAWALRSAVGGRAPHGLRIGVDRRIAVTTRDARTRDGDILADSFVGHRFTTIVWRPDGARHAQTLMVMADTFAADDFRRLRVVLRYGRTVEAAPETSGADAA